METDDEILAAVTAQLRAEIAASFPTVKAFAVAAGVDYGSLNRHLKGERAIRLDTLVVYLDALKVSPSEFFARSAARERTSQDG